MNDQEKQELIQLFADAGITAKKKLDDGKEHERRKWLARQFAGNGAKYSKPIEFILRHSEALCIQYVDKYAEYRDNAPGLAFFGNNGTGKTFAMDQLYNVFGNMDAVSRIERINCADIVVQWRENNNRLNDLFDEVKGRDIILDDLGLGMDSKSYGNECPMGLFFHRRHKLWKDTGRMTHITSHLCREEFDSYFGKQSLSRLYEMCLLDERYTTVLRPKANIEAKSEEQGK